MSRKQIRARNVCQWSEPGPDGVGVSHVLQPGEEGGAPADIADSFASFGAAEIIQGASQAARPAPEIPAQGTDATAVQEAQETARQALIERCGEMGIKVAGDETAEQLQTLIDVRESAEGILVDTLDLSNPAKAVLTKEGFETLGDLVATGREAVDAIKGMGDKTMEVIDAAMTEAGLPWGDPDSDIM